MELDRPLPLSAPGERKLLSQIRSLVFGASDPASAEGPVCSRFHADEDGVTRHYALSLTGSHDSCWGGGAGICGLRVVTIRDVTVEMEAAWQSDDYERRICEVRRVMSYAVITGGIIHEINQPVAAIRNYIHVLKMAPEFAVVASSSRRIVGHLGDEVNRISEIIRNVRAMGPQEAKLDGSCYLSEAVARSVRLLSLGATPPLAISIKTAASSDLQVRGSLPLIGQVIINLLRNALQASAAAGDSGAVVFLRDLDGFAEVAVADFGKGVSPEAAASMFEPFCQSEGDGMGLGLAICQRIAANLGGSIGWENREAGGALFTFKVPLAGKELTA
jgi:signal transduction histidine kinase